MKIDPGAKPHPLHQTAENRPAQGKADARPASSARAEVALSERASQLQALESQLAAVPVIDRAKVENIKQAIASGEYSVDAGKVAKGLIDSVKDMLHVAKPR